MKFTKDFQGVKNGDIYPTDFLAGDECPEELVEGAASLEAVDKAEAEPIIKALAEKRTKAAVAARKAAEKAAKE